MSEWIKCSEMLPEECDRVLVSDGKTVLGEAQLRQLNIVERQDGEVTAFGRGRYAVLWKAQLHKYRYFSKNYSMSPNGELYWDNITHWMPLPQPPTNEDSNDQPT